MLQLSFTIDFMTHATKNCHSYLRQITHNFQLHATFGTWHVYDIAIYFHCIHEGLISYMKCNYVKQK
jgi:hypothetical protein